MSSDKHNSVVWAGKPWIAPEAIVRSIFVLVIGCLVLWFEISYNFLFLQFVSFTLFDLTLLFFVCVWLASLAQLVVFWASNTYVLWEDKLEVKQGIMKLRLLTVTPKVFVDLTLNQTIGGWLFGYGDLMVNCQGMPQTRLGFLRSPFLTANTLRHVMGKPFVKMESPA